VASNIRWTNTQLQQHLAAAPARAHAYLTLTTQQQSAQAETLAKTDAPWTDRTGNARSGLTAQPVISRDSYAIVVYHKVPYGIYLETRWGGKYEIITTVVKTMTPRFTALATQVLMRIAAGG
jgi:hypothetical protein